MAQKKKSLNELIGNLKSQIDDNSEILESAIEPKEDNSEAVATPEMLINFISELDDIPSDNQYILNSIDNIEAIAKSLYPLFLVVSDKSVNPEKLLEIVDKYREGIVNSKNNVIAEGLLNLAKKQFLYSLKILIRRLNKKLLIKSEMSINELGEAMADLISGKEYEIREEIPQNDVKDILDSISRIFPEIILDYKPHINKATRLFREGNLQKSSSSLVTDTFFCVCVSKNIPFLKLNEELSELTATKKFNNGDITLQIAEEIENTLIKDFGIDTYKIFQILLCYWYENSGVMGKNVRVSVADLMEYIDRKNKVVKDPDSNKSMKLTREVNHSFLAHHTKLLDRVSVYSSGIRPNIKGKKDFAISQTKLIEFTEFIFFPKQPDGKIDYSNLKEVCLEYRVGKWFQYFNDEKYLTQYGYTHREAFSSSGLVSALLHWLAFKLEQNQRGEFKIKTIIDQIGLRDKLEAIYSETDPKKLSNLKLDLYRVLMSALKEIKEIDDPYQWEFKNPPQWLLDEALKPRGWIDTWLDVVIVFKHPQVLIDVGKEYRREKTIDVTPEAKPEKIKTTEDLKYVMDKFKISIRDLVKKSENKFTYYKLQKSLKDDKNNSLKDSEVRELITYCYRINQSRKK